MMISKKSRLPGGYQEVEYIESTGTQYIDTDFYPNQNTNFDTDINFISANEGTAIPLFACRKSFSEHPYYGVWISASKVPIYIYGGSNDTSSKGIILSNNIRTNIKNNRNKLYFNNIETNSVPLQIFQSMYNLFLFGLNNNGSHDGRNLRMKMYYFKLYDNDILIRNFIPCYRKSDNKVGMYDLAEDKFYTNQGTGEFLKGADV